MDHDKFDVDCRISGVPRYEGKFLDHFPSLELTPWPVCWSYFSCFVNIRRAQFSRMRPWKGHSCSASPCIAATFRLPYIERSANLSSESHTYLRSCTWATSQPLYNAGCVDWSLIILRLGFWASVSIKHSKRARLCRFCQIMQSGQTSKFYKLILTVLGSFVKNFITTKCEINCTTSLKT